ncbi:hypothetical protein [Streptomyces sp. NPDC012825]|uniref:hypothetical protein n=1 Tax=Streptomyces sp. NPDC012825 TaxID=3364851 RepID=UPI0036960004
METTDLSGRGLVAAVVSSIGIRHGCVHVFVTTGLHLDLGVPCTTRSTTPRRATTPAWTTTSTPGL